jgi:hypothetical protein
MSVFATNKAWKKSRSEERTRSQRGTDCGRRRRRSLRERRLLEPGLAFERSQDRIRFIDPADRFQPARRLRQRLPHVPDRERADPADHEHGPPAESRNDEGPREGADRQARHGDDRQYAHPPAAGTRRHELGQRREPDNHLGAEANAHDPAEDDQRVHRRGNSSGERGDAEDDQIGLVGEAAPVTVAEESGQKRADHHADERHRHEPRILFDGGEAAFQGGPEDRRCRVDIESVDEHADADQGHDAAMNGRRWQTVEPRPGCQAHTRLRRVGRDRHGLP